MDKIVPTALGDRVAQETMLPKEAGFVTCYGLFSLKNVATGNKRKADRIVVANGSLQLYWKNELQKPNTLLGQFSKVVLTIAADQHKISFWGIHFSERADEKPTEIELYQLSATELTLSAPTGDKGKLQINKNYLTLLYESICIQQKVCFAVRTRVLIFFLSHAVVALSSPFWAYLQTARQLGDRQ
jgi:hypothetical protein